jgi:hypothetical protein
MDNVLNISGISFDNIIFLDSKYKAIFYLDNYNSLYLQGNITIRNFIGDNFFQGNFVNLINNNVISLNQS